MNVAWNGPLGGVSGMWPIDGGTLARACFVAPAPIGVQSTPQTQSFDAAVAVSYARSHANPKSIKKCARYVTAAIARGFGALTDTDAPGTLSASSAVAKIEKVLNRRLGVAAPDNAKDYGPLLQALGFTLQKSVAALAGTTSDFQFEVGDVIIFQSTSATVPGHIQLRDASNWISDFVQMDPLWPNSRATSPWKIEQPAYAIYRHPDA